MSLRRTGFGTHHTSLCSELSWQSLAAQVVASLLRILPRVRPSASTVRHLLLKKRVDVILHGHDQSYQRTKQLALGPVASD